MSALSRIILSIHYLLQKTFQLLSFPKSLRFPFSQNYLYFVFPKQCIIPSDYILPWYQINNNTIQHLMTHMLSVQYIQKALLSTLENEKCADLHAGSCNAKAFQQFVNGCKGVYKMYLLVHLIPIIIFKRKKVVKDPVTELKKLVTGLIKSLLFAGGYSMLVRRTICFLTQHYSYKSIIAYIAGVLGGVSLVFEPMGRQSEIALYTLNKSMEVVYNMGLRRNLPVRLPMGQCILNGVAIAILAFVYLAQPETFRDSYRKVLDQLMKDI